jgi:hypothetical protein
MLPLALYWVYRIAPAPQVNESLSLRPPCSLQSLLDFLLTSLLPVSGCLLQALRETLSFGPPYLILIPCSGPFTFLPRLGSAPPFQEG